LYAPPSPLRPQGGKFKINWGTEAWKYPPKHLREYQFGEIDGGGLEEGETAIGDGGGVNWKDDGGGSGTLRIQPLVKAAKGPTPALAAAIENKSKVAAHLLKFTAEDGKMIAPSSNLLNVIDQNQRTMLHYAAISGSMELIRALTTEGVAIQTSPDKYTNHPLDYAFKEGSADIARALLGVTRGSSGALVFGIKDNDERCIPGSNSILPESLLSLRKRATADGKHRCEAEVFHELVVRMDLSDINKSSSPGKVSLLQKVAGMLDALEGEMRLKTDTTDEQKSERFRLVEFSLSAKSFRDGKGWLPAHTLELVRIAKCAKHLDKLSLSFEGITLGHYAMLLEAVFSESHGRQLKTVELHMDLQVQCKEPLLRSLPRTLKRLEKLEVLNLSGCSMEGKLIDELWSLEHLTVLDLSRNRFTGELSSKVAKLTKLKKLDVSFNMLDGALPRELGKLEKLQYLWLAGGDEDEGSEHNSFVDAEVDEPAPTDWTREREGDEVGDLRGFLNLDAKLTRPYMKDELIAPAFEMHLGGVEAALKEWTDFKAANPVRLVRCPLVSVDSSVASDEVQEWNVGNFAFDEVQAWDGVLSVKLSMGWCDQGWGGQKGNVYCKGKEGEWMKLNQRIAPHQYTEFEVDVAAGDAQLPLVRTTGWRGQDASDIRARATSERERHTSERERARAWVKQHLVLGIYSERHRSAWKNNTW
jgi:hypothetical protein